MKRSLALSIFLLLAMSSFARAQWSVEAGAGYVTERDTFTAPCGCHHIGATGYALEGSVSYDVASFLGLTIGSKVGGDYSSFQAAHDYLAKDPLKNVRDSAHFQMVYANIAPYVRYQIPLVGMFVQAEPSFGVLAYSHLYQRWHYTNPATHWSDGTADSIVEDNPLPNPTKLKLDARLSLGTSFGLFGLQVAPMFTLAYPLTENESSNKSGDSKSNWSLVTYWGSVAVRFDL